MDVEHAARQQAGYSGIAGALGGNAIRQPRTFDQIDNAVTELGELNKRLVSALDRLGHCADEPCGDDSDRVVLAQKLGTDYSRALNRLQRELRDLRNSIIALETHI